MYPADQQQAADHQHLRLLGIFHYIYGGLAMLGLVFLAGHYMLMRWIMGQASAEAAHKGGSAATEAAQLEQFLSWFVIFYVLGAVFFVALGIGNILAGRFLQQRRHRIFILIFAGLNCLNMPLGTVLGVFTFLVLFRTSVQDEFALHAS